LHDEAWFLSLSCERAEWTGVSASFSPTEERRARDGERQSYRWKIARSELKKHLAATKNMRFLPAQFSLEDGFCATLLFAEIQRSYANWNCISVRAGVMRCYACCGLVLLVPLKSFVVNTKVLIDKWTNFVLKNCQF